MRNYLAKFFEEFDYPAESRPFMLSAYDSIMAKETAASVFNELLASYDASYDIDYGAAIEKMKTVSADAGIHEYTGALLLFLCFSKRLEKYYEEAGLDRSIFVTSMYDLKYKIIECILVRGVWGSYVPSWFAGFFYLNRFGFCKLQFEIIKFNDEYEKDGIKLTKDSKVINVHIPRTGTRLDEESRKRSYAMAAEFYKDRMDGEPIVFVCSSWLLFPRHYEMMKPTSNLYAFMEDYDVFKSGLYDNYDQIWRLFDTVYNEDHSKLPQDTSLRREYVKLFDAGEKTGWGRGVYVYKG